MEIGAVYPQAEIGDDPAFIRDFAQAVEGAGYAYLTAFDHILGADASRFDGPIGGFPGPPYLAEDPFHEVFTLFSYLAGVTERLRFRPRVVILPQRETALVAKQATTLDRLSGGRLTMGVGVGWNFAEYEGLGADFQTRGRASTSSSTCSAGSGRNRSSTSTAASTTSIGSASTPARSTAGSTCGSARGRPTCRCGGWPVPATAGSRC